MKRTINIAILLIILAGSLLQVNAQVVNLPVACGGDKVRYKVSGTTHNPIFIWSITGGVITKEYNDSVDVQWTKDDIDVTGIRSITVQETTEKCVSEVFTGLLTVSSPKIKIFDTYEFCRSEKIEIDSKVNFKKYKWSNGDSTSILTVKESGTYNLTVTDEYGCTSTDNIIVNIHELPVVNLGPDTKVCRTAMELDAGPGFFKYNWSTGDVSRTIKVGNGDKLVWVQVEDAIGCAGGDTINIIKCENEFSKDLILKAFTPNGDGDNDTWCLDGIEKYPKHVVSIYDAWGRIVFQAKGNFGSTCWDGTLRGVNLPMDAYYYIIDLKNGSAPIVGDVTIVR
jgi:gliding motility-associated-like protein